MDPDYERIVDTPEWVALAEHQVVIQDVHLRELFADDPARGETMCLEVGDLYLDYSKNRLTAETIVAARRARPRGPASRSCATRCSPARRSTSPRTAPCSTSRCARPKGEQILVDGIDVVPEVHAVLDRMARLLGPGPLRCVDGTHREADPQRRQHRDRRQRPRPAHGLRGAEGLQRAVDDVPVRLERRRQRLLRGDAGPRSGGDAVHHRVEDVHHARDDDQRAHRPRLVTGRRSGRRGRREALRRGLDQRRRGRRSSGSTPRTCSSSGTGSAAATRTTPRSVSR